jgi:hypothetical protein
MCFRFLQVAWEFARTGELPQHDVAHVEGIDAPDWCRPPSGAGATGRDRAPPTSQGANCAAARSAEALQ